MERPQNREKKSLPTRNSWKRAVVGAAAASVGLALAVTATAAAPTLSLTATDAVAGQAIHATAHLGEGPSATGEISFQVFGPDNPTCAGSALEPAPTSALVKGEGDYVSGDFTPPGPGTYSWSAHYSGDLENEPADASCAATSTVAKASPGLTGSASSATVGAAIHDEATLNGGFSPTGEVTFSVFAPGDTDCSSPLATGSAPLQGATAVSADFSTQQAGEFRWTASYPGDANNEAAETVCAAAGQTSTVAKASPGLAGLATSVVKPGPPITDTASLLGGFAAGGQLVFRAYGPGDPTCAGAVKYEAAVPVNGDDSYSPTGFSPGPGLYQWTVEYGGDPNNEATGLPCGSPNQASAVGTISPLLTATATGATVGKPVSAAATIAEAASPTGQLTFKAFSPTDPGCAGPAVFSSTVAVSGVGSYRSAAFAPSRVGSFRWTVAYSGDANHAAKATGCGAAASNVTRALPSLAGRVRQRAEVGSSVRDAVALQNGFAPTGTISFRIYGPVAAGCATPALVDTIAITGNGSFQSDPFVPRRPGRYSFVASYSGDAANQAASEACDGAGQILTVRKRRPTVSPRGLLVEERRISIRARPANAISPSGVLRFRLYGPGDERCRDKPLFSGGATVKRNGTHALAEYLATKPGLYRLSVGYSGDRRNKRLATSCGRAQEIEVD